MLTCGSCRLSSTSTLTLLGFVNFRLYTSIGLVYPPKFDSKSEDQGAELGAFQLLGRDADGVDGSNEVVEPAANDKAQAEADRLLLTRDGEQNITEDDMENENTADGQLQSEANDALDQFAPIDEKSDVLLQPLSTADSSIAARLFEPFTFYLSRETPRHPLEFLLRAFGCKRIGWDSLTGEPGSYCPESDTRITHQVVDRPDVPLPSPPETDEDADSDFDGDAPPTRKSNEIVPGTDIHPATMGLGLH